MRRVYGGRGVKSNGWFRRAFRPFSVRCCAGCGALRGQRPRPHPARSSRPSPTNSVGEGTGRQAPGSSAAIALQRCSLRSAADARAYACCPIHRASAVPAAGFIPPVWGPHRQPPKRADRAPLPGTSVSWQCGRGGWGERARPRAPHPPIRPCPMKDQRAAASRGHERKAFSGAPAARGGPGWMRAIAASGWESSGTTQNWSRRARRVGWRKAGARSGT